jgi:hypothetical protein
MAHRRRVDMEGLQLGPLYHLEGIEKLSRSRGVVMPVRARSGLTVFECKSGLSVYVIGGERSKVIG